MTRFAILGLLACSFVTVQTHVWRERALPAAVHTIAGQAHGGGERPILGGGTTRALTEARNFHWYAAALPAALSLPRPMRPLGEAEVAPFVKFVMTPAAAPILRI
jgi:hypothetical protein